MNFELSEESKSWNPYCLLLKREREMKLLALVQAKIAFGSFINDFTNSTSGPDLNFPNFPNFSKIPDFIFGLLFVYSARNFIWDFLKIFENFENDFNSAKVVNVHMIQNHLTVRVAQTTIHVHVFGPMKTDVATVSGSVQKSTQETMNRF